MIDFRDTAFVGSAILGVPDPKPDPRDHQNNVLCWRDDGQRYQRGFFVGSTAEDGSHLQTTDGWPYSVYKRGNDGLAGDVVVAHGIQSLGDAMILCDLVNERERPVQAVAERFVILLRAEVDDAHWEEMIRRNRDPSQGPGVCASHDFCDANMPMAAAFEQITGREPECGSDHDANLWNDAWDRARELHLGNSAKPEDRR